jgi:transcriptional regulator with XRE-family HTH domain
MGIRFDRLRALREEHEYTLRYVGKKVGVAESTAQRHESSGIKDIPYDIIVKYATLYNVNPAYLVGWTDDPRPPEQAEREAQYYQDPDVLRLIQTMEKDGRYKILYDAIPGLSPESAELVAKMIEKFSD